MVSVEKASLAANAGQYDDAKLLDERPLRIIEATLGEHHPIVARTCANLASMGSRKHTLSTLYPFRYRTRSCAPGHHQII